MLGQNRVSLSFPGETAEFFNQRLSLECIGSGSSPCRFSGFTYFLLLRVIGVGQVNLEEPGGRKQKGRRDDSHPEAVCRQLDSPRSVSEIRVPVIVRVSI